MAVKVAAAHIPKAIRKVPVTSARNPANAGPMICPIPKKRVMKPNALAARVGPR